MIRLRIILSTGYAFAYSLKDMSVRAGKDVPGILKLLWDLGEQCPKIISSLIFSIAEFSQC